MSDFWRTKALCASHDPELWFPNPQTNSESIANLAKARRVCRACPVSTQCLEFALDKHIGYGVWGGLTAHERNAVRGRHYIGEKDPEICGTLSGYKAHYRYGERPCQLCIEFKNHYQRFRRLTKGKGRILQPCGTPAAFKRHKMHGEEPCAECRKAKNEHDRAWRASKKEQRSNA